MSDGPSSRRLDGRSRWQVRIPREFWDEGLSAEGPHVCMVYLTLRAYEDGQTRTTPIRINRVAEKAGMSRSSVKNAIRRLRELGWIDMRGVSGGPSVYVLGDGGGYFADRMGRSPGDPPGGETGLPDNQVESATGLPDNHPTRVCGNSTGLPDNRGWLPDTHPVCNTSLTNTDLPKTSPPVGPGRKIRRVRQPSTLRLDPEEKTTPLDPPSALVQVPGSSRRVPPWELRHLESARAKKSRGGAFSPMELVAVWRQNYFAAFGVEDSNLETQGQWRRASAAIQRKAVSWFDGSWADVARYVRYAISQGEKLVADGKSPPKLMNLLRKNRGDYPWMLTEWRRKRAGRGR